MFVPSEPNATDLVQPLLSVGLPEPQRGVATHLRSHSKSGSEASPELGALGLAVRDASCSTRSPRCGCPSLGGPCWIS